MLKYQRVMDGYHIDVLFLLYMGIYIYIYMWNPMYRHVI